jgi:hypothetical protein
MTEEIIKAKLGDHVTIEVLPEEARDAIQAASDAQREPRFYQMPDDDPLTMGPQVSFHDIATSFGQVDQNARIGWSLVLNTGKIGARNQAANFQNGYYELDTETLSQDFASMKQIREGYLTGNPFGYSEAAPSGRQIANAWPLTHDCGNLFLDFHLYNQGVDRKTVLHAGERQWQRRITSDARLANFLAAKPHMQNPLSRQWLEATENQLKLATDELWHAGSSALSNNSGLLRPKGLLGAYDCRMDSPFYYEPFDIRSNEYYATDGPEAFSSRVEIPQLHFAKGSTSKVRVFMVPQYWRCIFRWRAWYLWVTMWAFSYIAVPGVAQFLNRFPLFPRPFQLGSTDYPPINFWIERSRAHQRAVDQDFALQFFSVFMAFIFIFTSDAIFEIRRTNTFPGMLAAVIEINGKLYYIWRATGTNRDLTIPISQGPLDTYHFNSFGTTIIGTSQF